MKKVSVFFLLVASASLSFAEVATKKSAPKPVPVKAGAVVLSPANSRIDFVGEHEGPKPDPRKGGFAKFTGKAEVDDSSSLKSVAFTFDTASLWSEIPKLSAHLKSPDFFDVREHAKASFESTSIAPANEKGTYDVKGKFTLLGETKEIKIPATVSVDPTGVTLVSKFNLDRTEFGMDYGIGKVKKDVAISVVIGEPTPKGRKE